MGQTGNAGRVDFEAYCKAFEILQPAEWDAICSKLDGEGEGVAVDYLYREDTGDGYVRVPEYGVRKGKLQEVTSRWLSQDGRLSRTEGEYSRTLTSVDSELARYFIAGAFGMKELKGEASSIDPVIVKGLSNVYGLCMQDLKGCLASSVAKKTSDRWQRILAERKDLEERTSAVAQLKEEYDQLSAKVEDKGQLLVGVAPYKSQMPRSLKTRADLEVATENLREMVAVAKAVIETDGKRRVEEKRRAEAETKRAKTVSYLAEIPAMRARISKAEGPWMRFTEAYDEAMKCMPTPSSSEEAYCVAKNKYEMADRLRQRANNFPERWVCDSWKTKTRHHCGKDGCDSNDEQVCERGHSEGKDYTSAELLSFAKNYCSSTCQ